MDKKTTDSRSVEKVLNQLRKLVDTDKFQSKVLTIRAALGIPVDGLEMTPQNKAHLGDPYYIPEGLVFEKNLQSKDFTRKVWELTGSIEDMLAVRDGLLSQIIRGYLYYDSLEVEEISSQMFWMDQPALCQFRDMGLMLSSLFKDGIVDSHRAIIFVEDLMRSAKQYPLLINIHPDATQRDIVSYIEKNWDRIERVQMKYLVSANKSLKNSKITVNQKNKDIRDFVYKNRNLSLKEISKNLAKELGEFRDEGAIGKIRSREKKRREE